MKQNFFPAVILTLCFVINGQQAVADTPNLTVQGTGSISSEPDMATVSVGVESADADAGQAMDKTSAVIGNILNALKENNIEAKDVQTSQLSLYPRYADRVQRDGPPQVIGFVASAELRVRIYDLENTGPVLGVLTGIGANRLGGISFGLSDPQPAKDQALAAAVKDALRKAKIMADASGHGLGDIKSIQEAGVHTPGPQPFARAELAQSSVPIAAGELATTATVTLTVELE